MNSENINIKINKELETLGDEFIILLTSKPEYYFDSVLKTVKFITDKGMGGVYITTSRPYRFIKNRLEEYSTDTENLFFIDTISCMAGESYGERERCVFIENPTAIEEVGMWIDILMDRVNTENKFLIIDSLSTMLIYNEITALKEFSQFLISRMRLTGTSGVFASIDTETQNICGVLSTLCDKTIKV